MLTTFQREEKDKHTKDCSQSEINGGQTGTVSDEAE